MDTFVPVKLASVSFEPNGGTGDALSPLIFMHGVGGCKENWLDIPQIIADKTQRKAYSLDVRNHGESEYTDSLNIDACVVDLFHFMDTIDAPKAVLIGQSMGGLIAIKAALKHPERVEAMFSEDMYPKNIPPELLVTTKGFLDLWCMAVQMIPKGLSEKEGITHCVDFLYSQIPPGTPGVPPKESMTKLGIKLKRKEDGSFTENFNKVTIMDTIANIDKIMTEPSGRYDGPACFIYGGASPFRVDQEEELIMKLFPRAELIKFEGASHNVHPEFPEKFIDTVTHRL